MKYSLPISIDSIFEINSQQQFNEIAIEIFRFQYKTVSVYHDYIDLLGINPLKIEKVEEIPFLPIEFFKTHEVLSGKESYDACFESSGTTGASVSKHFVKDLELYQKSMIKGFEHFFGPVDDYCVLALLPSYLERNHSSLVFMVDDFIHKSKYHSSGFFLKNLKDLSLHLQKMNALNVPTLLIGVSFALLDLAKDYPMFLNNTIVMETGGMKGRRKELVRSELHTILQNAFGVDSIASEYGMTELLSQAYSNKAGIFETPSWMQILIRDVNDPFTYREEGKTGGVNVIDLANVYSCSFIATQDLGKIVAPNKFEILGRFDNSDIRGCNLLVVE